MASDIPSGPHTLKLGASFSKKAGDTYHTIRYDFKPASLEVCKESYVDCAPSGETTVSFPKVDASDNIKDVTLFKGSRKPYQKECLLIYDHETGEFTLEDLTHSIQVKQVRSGEEEKEKNVQYVKDVRRKCRRDFPPKIIPPKIDNETSESSSNANNSTAMDLLMSDEESDDSSSSSSNSSDEEVEKTTTAVDKSANDEQSEEDESEDDIAKSLEAVIATNVPTIEKDAQLEQVKIEKNAQLKQAKIESEPAPIKRPAVVVDRTLHDDLHLSDSSEDDN